MFTSLCCKDMGLENLGLGQELSLFSNNKYKIIRNPLKAEERLL